MIRLGMVLGAALLLAGCDKSTPEERADAECRSTGSARQISHTFVKRHLKSPGSAEFPYVLDDGVNVTYLGDCEHDVISYVDADNSFGANIRTPYYAKVRYNKASRKWSLLDINM